MTLTHGLLLVCAVAACSREPARAGHPIDTVNPVIGDASFVHAFGRAPTPGDGPELRVRTHLAYVEQLLRAAAVGPARRAARERVLDHLHRYLVAERFPASETDVGLLPTFIDRAGVRCAVAYLVEQDLGEPAIRAIDERYHNAYIAEIDAPSLARWAAASGLSRDELALIQPSYPPRHAAVELGVAAEYANSVSEDSTAGKLGSEGLVRGRVRRIFDHNRWMGDAILGLDGAIGWASGGDLAYDAHLTLGSQVGFWLPGTRGKHLVGATAGIGVDAIGDRIPRAWTIPIDTYWYVQSARRVRLGVIAGPRFAIAGADRRIGWRAAIDLVRRDLIDSQHALAPRDVHVQLGVERVADATFVNVSVGATARSRFGYWSD
jgi:hypothetical protein